jgi:hypothetical protein
MEVMPVEISGDISGFQHFYFTTHRGKKIFARLKFVSDQPTGFWPETGR